jgi:hypothetical protein
MIVQSISSVYEKVRDAIVSRVYKQLVDEQSQKVYYECIVYTRKGDLEVHTDNHTIDKKV